MHQLSYCHTIVENLISPCIQDAVQCMLGKEHVQKMNGIHLLNNTISRRTQDMFDDVEATVIDRIKNSKFFGIQLDESTDVTNFFALLVIGKYLKGNEVEESLLLCHPQLEHTNGEDIFNATDCYF